MAEPDDAPDRDPRVTGESSVQGEPEDETAQQPKGKRRHERRQLPLWQELIVLLVIALGMAIVLKTLFIQLFYIPSASMSDTLIQNDRISVEKVSYWFGEPQRGDIVVFADPGGWLPMVESHASNPLTDALEFFGLYPAGDHLVKRVIGVGGDRVRCCDGQGRIVVNGEPLEESAYLPRTVRPSQQEFDVRVPEGRLWVMGDNRANSADSRAHLFENGGRGGPGAGRGPTEREADPRRATIPLDAVVGRVFATVWPPGRASLTDRPESFESIADGDGS